MKIELICQCCDKPFETEYKFRDKKFCSRGCYFENVRKGKLKIGRNKDESIREVRLCKVCDKEFEVKKNHSKEMCSNECRVKWGENDVVKQKRLISIKKTVQEKYGVNHVWNNKDIHQKTMDNRDLTISSEKQKNTVREKHIVKIMSRFEDNNLKIKQAIFEWILSQKSFDKPDMIELTRIYLKQTNHDKISHPLNQTIHEI